MELWVIKVGTSILRGTENNSTQDVIKNLSNSIIHFISKGNKVVIVTSGAVGLGCKKLALKKRPDEISFLQAAAAIGQVKLMTLYEKEMNNFDKNVAQILITKTDFNTRKSFKNASETLKKLLDLDVIPIINENDTIANEELKYGDNDTLSALVALAINAKKLILLTDINNLYSKDPKENIDATPIREVHDDIQLNEIKSSNINSNNLGDLKRGWGTGERLLARGFLVEGPTWAPNGRVLMYFKQQPFEADGSGGDTHVYRIDITGFNEKRIITPSDASDPAWSPALR